MNAPLYLHLGGHLNYYDPQSRPRLEIDLHSRARLVDLLARLHIPTGEVYLTALNGELVDLPECWVQPGDRVELFPPMGGG